MLIELPWLENPASTSMRHTEHWQAVSTLLGLISSAPRDLHLSLSLYIYIYKRGLCSLLAHLVS